MTDTQDIPWKRLSVEAAAIIASILFAFAIDAWWDSVQTDNKTQEILDALRLEMESNLINLQGSIAHHEEIVEAVRVAQDQKSTAGVQETAVIDVEVFEPNTGALDTLIATGMLGDIDDPALQISLGAFTGFATDLRERESRAVEFRDAARRRIAAIGEPIWNMPDPVRVQSDVQMLNLLTMRQAEEIAAIESARSNRSFQAVIPGLMISI
jgi:hypothetical protein